MSDRLLKESDVLKIAFQLPLVVNSAFADAVKALPSADRPKGCWFYSWSIFSKGYECTNCHKKSIAEYDYCPNCGAHMKGADDELR